MKRAVVLIIVHKPDPSQTEIKSLVQCAGVLRCYRIVLICPRGMDVKAYREVAPQVEFEFIDPKWQATYRSFNRLKISPLLYRKYSDYQYILFYELDAWVFRDELEYWCDQGFDYIGAPWFEGWYKATGQSQFAGIGNGGFSLRKVNSHLKAIHRLGYVRPPKVLWEDFKAKKNLKSVMVFLLSLTFWNNTFFLFNNFRGNEDFFWGRIVGDKFNWKIPDLATAARFSIEANSQALYEMNGNQLPFGCHKWEKYETGFWKQFIQ
jgi:hypothetical protein